jgi:hypothetical protein
MSRPKGTPSLRRSASSLPTGSRRHGPSNHPGSRSRRRFGLAHRPARTKPEVRKVVVHRALRRWNLLAAALNRALPFRQIQLLTVVEE